MIPTKFLYSSSMYSGIARILSGMQEHPGMGTFDSGSKLRLPQYDSNAHLSTSLMNKEAVYVICAQIMILSDIRIQKYSRYLVVDLLYRLQSKHSLTFAMIWIAIIITIMRKEEEET